MRTVQQAAKLLKRPRRTVAHWCEVYDVGTMLTPRQRVLSAADVERLREIGATMKRGRPWPSREE